MQQAGGRVVERLATWNAGRAFGFTESGVFVHVADVADGHSPTPGESISFERAETRKGPRARDVRREREW